MLDELYYSNHFSYSLTIYKNYPIIYFISFVFSFVGIGTALINGIPLTVGHIDNDGNNTLTMIKDSQTQRAFWIQMKINEYMSHNYRLKDMPSP